MFEKLIGAAFLGLIVAGPAYGQANDKPGGTPDPQMQAVLDQMKALDPKPIETLSASDARQQPTPADAVKQLLKKQGKTTNQEPVQNEDDQKIPGPVGNIPVRVYTPGGTGPFPVLVYYHGGGFVIATIDTYESSCRALCNGAKCVVVSVEYRKAPENKYPAALDDAFAAYQWVTQNAAKINGDPQRIAVAGESAGGNLATETCIKAVESGTPLPVFQLLVYPVANNDMTTESYTTNSDAKPLSKAMMAWFFEKYLSDPNSGTDPHVSPMRADPGMLGKLPPAMVITASIDPLIVDAVRARASVGEIRQQLQRNHLQQRRE